MTSIQYFLPLVIQTPASYAPDHPNCALPLLPCGASLTVIPSRKETEIGPFLPPPYIRLEDLLDEPMGRGWGVDISGFGPTLNFSSLQVVLNGPITPWLAKSSIAGPHAQAFGRFTVPEHSRRYAPVLLAIA